MIFLDKEEGNAQMRRAVSDHYSQIEVIVPISKEEARDRSGFDVFHKTRRFRS